MVNHDAGPRVSFADVNDEFDDGLQETYEEGVHRYQMKDEEEDYHHAFTAQGELYNRPHDHMILAICPKCNRGCHPESDCS